MNIREALDQMKETSEQFIEAIKGLSAFIDMGKDEVSEMMEEEEKLKTSIADKNTELLALQEKYKVEFQKLNADVEVAKEGKNRMLKELRDSSQKEYDEITASYGVKVKELNDVLKDLQGKANDLAAVVIEKQKLLDGLNKSIDAIKSRLG